MTIHNHQRLYASCIFYYAHLMHCQITSSPTHVMHTQPSSRAWGNFAFISFHGKTKNKRDKNNNNTKRTKEKGESQRTQRIAMQEAEVRDDSGRRGFMMAVLSRAAPWTVLAWCDPPEPALLQLSCSRTCGHPCVP